jgi:Icc-related predicted phosphoesterase
MRILAISDQVVPQVYDASIKARFSDVEMVLSCGDLPGYYLDFVVSMLNVPLFYVMGNHGRELERAHDDGRARRPGGCTDIDERVVEHGGLLIAGLEGSMRYKEGPYQYTERQMSRKALRLGTKLLGLRLLKGRRLDILIAHAPPQGIHDGRDLCHSGFRALLKFMERHGPQYLIHGHSHLYDQLQPTTTRYGSTVVANAFPYRVIDVPPRGQPGEHAQ